MLVADGSRQRVMRVGYRFTEGRLGMAALAGLYRRRRA